MIFLCCQIYFLRQSISGGKRNIYLLVGNKNKILSSGDPQRKVSLRETAQAF